MDPSWLINKDTCCVSTTTVPGRPPQVWLRRCPRRARDRRHRGGLFRGQPLRAGGHGVDAVAEPGQGIPWDGLKIAGEWMLIPPNMVNIW